MGVVVGYFFIINFLGIVLIAQDKAKAKKHLWRISEKTLFLVAIVGGSVGMYWALRGYRHKTKHKKFMIGIPLIIMVQMICGFLIINMF